MFEKEKKRKEIEKRRNQTQPDPNSTQAQPNLPWKPNPNPALGPTCRAQLNPTRAHLPSSPALAQQPKPRTSFPSLQREARFLSPWACPTRAAHLTRCLNRAARLPASPSTPPHAALMPLVDRPAPPVGSAFPVAPRCNALPISQAPRQGIPFPYYTPRSPALAL